MAIIIKEKNNNAIEIVHEGVRMVWRQKGNSVVCWMSRIWQ